MDCTNLLCLFTHYSLRPAPPIVLPLPQVVPPTLDVYVMDGSIANDGDYVFLGSLRYIRVNRNERDYCISEHILQDFRGA